MRPDQRTSQQLRPATRDAVLAAATAVLVRAPQTSLGELAQLLGIGRTTLHRMFPTRADLLAAMAHAALDDLNDVYAQVGLTQDVEPAEALEVLRRLVTRLVPLGPSLMLLMRTAELDADAEVTRRAIALDGPVQAAIDAARSNGDVRANVPAWWASDVLFAIVYAAWLQIDYGRLAPLDAAAFVLTTWTAGVAGPALT